MKRTVFPFCLLIVVNFVLTGCLPNSKSQAEVHEAEQIKLVSSSKSSDHNLQTDLVGRMNTEQRIGFEIIELRSRNERVAWRVLSDMTLSEFDSLELPWRWVKNSPREIEFNEGVFTQSPDAGEPGKYIDAEHFNYEWRHVASLSSEKVKLDKQDLLSGVLVSKSHQLSWDAGRSIYILSSPEGDYYIRVTRDLRRISDDFTMPDGWRLLKFVTSEELVIELPNPTVVIRTDNEDSFQGPVPELAKVLKGVSQ